MTTVQLRISLAVIVALGLAQGCSTKKQEPATNPAVVAGTTKSPFPAPVIEVGSDDDPETPQVTPVIYWQKDTYRLSSLKDTETNGRISDEVTWRIKHFKVVDSSGDTHPKVEWVVIMDGPTEKATISRLEERAGVMGGQFIWKVAGVTPDTCSWYNASTEVQGCAHGSTPLGFTGIPASLFGFVPTFHARFKRGNNWVEEDVKVIKLQGDTCK
jgi:hypothetical protein